MGFFKKLVSGLAKTRANFSSGLNSVFKGFSHIDDDFYEELEEILIMSDMGVSTTENILEALKERVHEEKIKEPEDCRRILMENIKAQMDIPKDAYDYENGKCVILVVGVNGVGKTTSIGRMALTFKTMEMTEVKAAADTFRAAAGEQLETWAKRAGVDIIGGQEGADPGSVVFDAVTAAKSRNADILLCDTAGRLHNKKNLMEELKKLYRIIGREYPDARIETFIVVDGTTGQNALIQAREFSQAAPVTGIVLTKLDGTAKGGIAVAIHSELSIPVKFIGVGESIEDLQRFDPDSFVEALFEEV